MPNNNRITDNQGPTALSNSGWLLKKSIIKFSKRIYFIEPVFSRSNLYLC